MAYTLTRPRAQEQTEPIFWEEIMSIAFRSLLVLACTLALLPLDAAAWDRGHVETFATLPAGTAHPEGIAVDGSGNVYVTTFDVSASSGPGKIVVFDANGNPQRTLTVEGSSNLLLGIAFHPRNGAMLVVDFGAGQVLRVDPTSGKSKTFMSVGKGSGLNALAFDASGNVYVSDSFQGIVWRTGIGGGKTTAWVTDDLLLPHGTPPFGANGMGFDSHGALFVANTADDRIIRIP